MFCFAENGDFFTAKLPTKFTAFVTMDQWQHWEPEQHHGYRSMGGPWKYTMRELLIMHVPSCVPAFRKNKVAKENSRKSSTAYWSLTAYCAFKDCETVYSITVDKPKAGDVNIPIHVELRGTICHSSGETRATRCDGAERATWGKEAASTGPTELFHRKLGEISDKEFVAGNLSHCKNPGTLKKASYDNKKNQRLHEDVIAELIVLKRHICMEDNEYTVLSGYIQLISCVPFSVHLYSEGQFKCCDSNANLYLDATGTVCQQIPDQAKQVYYYAIVSKGEANEPAIPVAEMLTNDHTTINIGYFLQRMSSDYCKVIGKELQPQKVEVDFSWAMIHAAILAFNKTEVVTYLQESWKLTSGASEEHFKFKTVVHLCSAHIMHMIMRKVASAFKNKQTSHFLGNCVGLLVNATSLEDADDIFKSLCVLFANETSKVVVADAMTHLHELTCKTNSMDLDSPSDEGQLMDDEDMLDDASERGPLYQKSPFYGHFKHVSETAKLLGSDEAESPDQNEYYSPKLVDYFVKSLMPYFPLWSALLLHDMSHDTNAVVENWMGAFKAMILNKRTSLRPGEIVEELRKSLKGRTRRHGLKKRKTKKGSCDEESWRKKPRMPKAKRPTYLQKQLKAASVSPPKDKPAELEAIEWGGEYNGISLTQTCTVDTGLQIMHMIFTYFPHIRKEVERSSDSTLRVLLQCTQLVAIKESSHAKYVWLEHTQAFTSSDDNTLWNVWGGEASNFVGRILSLQTTTATSTCSEVDCKRQQRTITNREVILK